MEEAKVCCVCLTQHIKRNWWMCASCAEQWGQKAEDRPAWLRFLVNDLAREAWNDGIALRTWLSLEEIVDERGEEDYRFPLELIQQIHNPPETPYYIRPKKPTHAWEGAIHMLVHLSTGYVKVLYSSCRRSSRQQLLSKWKCGYVGPAEIRNHPDREFAYVELVRCPRALGELYVEATEIALQEADVPLMPRTKYTHSRLTRRYQPPALIID